MWIKIIGGLALFVTVVACGRVSDPIPPEGSFYPHDYAVTQEDTPLIP